MTDKEGHSHPHYFWVCGWLAALTLLEVLITEMDLGAVTSFWSLALLAIIKAMLVALFFMHLMFERLRLIFFVMTPVLGTVLLLIFLLIDAWGIAPA